MRERRNSRDLKRNYRSNTQAERKGWGRRRVRIWALLVYCTKSEMRATEVKENEGGKM